MYVYFEKLLNFTAIVPVFGFFKYEKTDISYGETL